MNELNNECKKEMAVPPVSKGEQKGNGCSARFQNVRVFYYFFWGKAKECTAKPGQRGAIRSKGQH